MKDYEGVLPEIPDMAVITDSMTINGDVICDGNIEMRGNIIGNMAIQGKIIVGGCIDGDLFAKEIYTESAKITGEVKSEGNIKIEENSIIIGNVSAENIVNAGAVKGDITVSGAAVLDTSAIVMGNIRSESLQINRGAVMEGMCSMQQAKVKARDIFNRLLSQTEADNFMPVEEKTQNIP